MWKTIRIFVLAFFISLNFGLLLYINSSFLSIFFPSWIVSLLFILGAMGNITLFFLAPRFLKVLDKSFLLFLFLVIAFLSGLYMSTATGAAGVAIAFLSYSSVIYMIYYCLDIFLEELSVDRHTGELRGLYSIFLNGGIMLGPLLVVLIARDDNVRPVYLVGAALLIVAVLLLSNSFKIKNNHHKEPIPLPFKKWRHSANIRRVTLAKLVLEIFFTLMVIYTPLYLHNELGFAWRELGIIFTIMLLPFVIFEWPVGELADRFWGEKEMMSLGFFITGSALLIMPFLDKVFAAWLLILLLSRVGASIVEITTESYFFKQISASETGMLSIFRLVRPVGIILGALIGALTLQILAFTTIFFVVAFVIFLGIRESAYLKDTL